MKKTKVFIFLLMVVFFGIGAIFAIVEGYEERPVFLDEEINLVMEDEVINEYGHPLLEDGEIYLPFDFIKNHLDKELVLSEDQKKIFVNLEDKAIVLEDPYLMDFIKENKTVINIPTRLEEGQAFVRVSLLNKVLKIEVSYVDETKTVIVDPFQANLIMGEIMSGNAKIQSKKEILSISSPKLKLGEQVKIFGEEDGWYRVRNEDGLIGFVREKYIRSWEKEKIWDGQLNEKREPFERDGAKINIAWEYVGKKSPDLSKEDRIESLDVVVPTWFSIEKDDATVINHGDQTYVEKAHELGYKVWGLVNNDFDPALTSTILNNDLLRKKVIGQLIFYASLYDLDGINIDFENVYYDDKDQLVKFVEELRYYTQKQNLVLSMDVTVPSTSERWSKVYDREKIGNIVDYVAVMTYDEHWGSSPVSGSVASIGWVERGIIRSMEKIPQEKILLGLPFYTRRWEEYRDEFGKLVVKSKALSMESARKSIGENGAEPLWDEKSGQYYAQYEDGDVTYKIWLEDPRSIGLKASLVEKYNLGGTASWRRGFEDVAVWPVLQEIIKNGKNHKELVYLD